MTHDELVIHAYRWTLRNGCGVAFKELVAATANGEIPDVIGFGNWKSVLIECKASRSDFFRDRRKKFRVDPKLGMGRYRFYCCPHGMIKPEELPEKWGLIYVERKATVIVKPSEFQERDIRSEQCLMYSALRRLHLRGHIESIYESPFVK